MSDKRPPKLLLDRFGLVTEDDFAALIGVTVKTLQNRRRSDLPRRRAVDEWPSVSDSVARAAAAAGAQGLLCKKCKQLSRIGFA